MLLPSLPCPWRHYDVIISDMTSLLLRHAVWFLYESYSLNIFISILLDAVNGTPYAFDWSANQNWTDKPSRISSSHKHVILSRISDHVTSFEDGWVISDPIMTSSPTDSPKKIGLFPTAKPITNFSWRSWTIKYCKIQSLLKFLIQSPTNSELDSDIARGDSMTLTF